MSAPTAQFTGDTDEREEVVVEREADRVAIYVDGDPHDENEQQTMYVSAAVARLIAQGIVAVIE